MEKGYFPTSLIKFQVENKTDISYLINKNIKIGDHEYALRKFTEKPRQNNRYRCYNENIEKPRQQYRYVKPHPSTRYRKDTNTAEKTNIEEITNHQKTLADYARRLEKIHEDLKQLTNALHIIKRNRKLLKETEEKKDLLEKRLRKHFEYAF